MHKKSNIVLIGMPGSGKSTVGVILAKMLKKNYLDTDILIQDFADRTLQEIVDSDGHMALRTLEEQVLTQIECKNHIIATGGSAAYSEKAMTHLQIDGMVVFLHASIQALKSRINNYDTRGLAKRPEQSFQNLFDERRVLYNRFADLTIESSTLTQDEVCGEITAQLQSCR